MPVLFPPPEAVLELLEQAKQHHSFKELIEADVTIKTMMAEASGKSKKSALQLHGYPCAAIIKITPYEQRVKGAKDCSLHVDSDWWEEHDSEPERLALLEHELTHLNVVRDKKTGAIKYDNANRPKLRMRLHDMTVGGFTEIAQRHGLNALESQHYIDLHKRMVQLELFPEG